MKTLTLLGISGSLREKSLNHMLMTAALTVAGRECTIEHLSIRDVPLYNQDNEDQTGIPQVVKDLQNKIAECHGLMIATPEYNHSVPGVLKNTIDWLTRPPSEIERVFKNLPVAIMGATPGSGATTASQMAWLPIFDVLGARVFMGEFLGLPKANELFADDGSIRDTTLRAKIETFMKGYLEFVHYNRKARQKRN